MEQPAGATSGRMNAVVTLGGEHFVLRESGALSLSKMTLDGTIADDLVLEPEMFLPTSATAVVVEGTIVTVWGHTDGTTPVLRYAALDQALGTVVAPRDIIDPSSEYIVATALVPSASGGVALLYAESDGAGQTTLRLVPLDAEGNPAATPLDVADLGRLFATVTASAVATPEGGHAVSYAIGDRQESEVFFVILEADGTPRFEPQRISRAAVDGYTSELGGPRRRSMLRVGDRYWVAFTETWYDGDPSVNEGYVVVQLAIVDGSGQSEGHVLQAPVAGLENQWPSFVELDDRVGLMWTSGTIISVCAGCISNHDLHFVLLDPDAIVPASNVVTQLHQGNGITAPVGDFAGSDMLTAASLDFHALTFPASGAIHCEPAG